MLRDYLFLFALRNWKKVEENYSDNSLYENLKLKKRDLQIWKPLLAIAKLVGNDWFKEVSEFAEKISLQRKEDFISEDSWDFKILKIVLSILESESEIIRAKEVRTKYIQDYSDETERAPFEKTIIKKLDQIGFKELKQPRDNQGNFYSITKEDFFIIVNPICPTLSIPMEKEK